MPQPQNGGWTEVFSAPPNPVFAIEEMTMMTPPHELRSSRVLASLAARWRRRRRVRAAARRTLKIGVTLHPYYSWTKNVVGTLPGYEVRSILPGEIDAGDYQPRPDDIKKLADLDAIVVNGIGHDDFIMPMIKASGNTKLVIIRPNEPTPQIHAARGTGVNSHTFISFTNAIQQTYAIQKALAALRPQDAAALQRNAGRLRPPAAADQGEGGAAAGRGEDHARRDRARRLRLPAAGVRPRGRRRRPAGARADAVGGRAARHGASCCSARRFASCSARRRFRRRC